MTALRLAPLLLLAGCATATPTPPPAAAAGLATGDWRTLATAGDRARLRGWREAFVTGLAEARSDGRGAVLSAEGALFDPDAGLDDATMPAGAYRCRVTKLGRQAQGGLPYVAYPFFRCRVGAPGLVQSFEKLTGSQRQVGALHADGSRRRVFLGTLTLGDERLPLRYGQDGDRDVIGALERIGESRWRLIFPSPRFESKIDVMEIVPE